MERENGGGGMKCRNCKFYQGGYMWNRCVLTESECFRECIKEPCNIIDDDYIFITDCEPLGFIKGEKAGGAE